MFTKSLITAGLVGLALCTQPAVAAPAAKADTSMQQVQQRLVPYADLDISTPEGQARLNARLRHAAAAVCGASYGAHPLTEVMESRRCYRDALQSAQRSMASLGKDRLGMAKVAAR
jgi:hypothetical protein